MSKKTHIEYSKFWLGNDFDLDKELGKGNTIDLLRLAGFRRAISNFVFILTGQNIPVRFSEKSGQSMTDGKVVYIGGDLSHGEFDATVGLSLHEAMHIVKSDFTIIKNMWQKVPKSVYDAAGKKLSKSAVADFTKYVLNVVEDRYIDAWAYESAPGYRGYYIALYDRYFNLPKISSALKSDAFRTPTLKSYTFRLTNITNPNTDLSALPGLRDIYELLDLNNILRLTEPQDRMDIATKIVEIIVKNIIEADEKKNKNQKSSNGAKENDSEESSGESEEAGESGEDSDSDDDDKKSEDGAENIDDNADPFGDSVQSGHQKVSDEEKQKELSGEYADDKGDLTDRQMEDLQKLIQKQLEVVNRDIKQKEFDGETIKKLDLLEKSGVDLISVGGEMGIPKTNCIVARNMTKELIESPEFPYNGANSSIFLSTPASEGVKDGIVMGAMLGRLLQVRGESRTTRHNRLEVGKFDRRRVSDLGFNCKNVFFRTQVDKFKNAHMHISVDASSSMGNKWKKTMTTVVAMAKAASMVNNLGVTISFRSGVSLNQRNAFSDNELPYVVLAYDSRLDKFSKVAQLFPLLSPKGSTPEGLAFEAILKTIPPSTPDLDSYFINLSDGEPAFDDYFGSVAHEHTRRQVCKIRESSIEVLSYFIEVNGESNSRVDSNMQAFREMYGKDAQLIDVNRIGEIAKTMNKKFLQKSE